MLLQATLMGYCNDVLVIGASSDKLLGINSSHLRTMTWRNAGPSGGNSRSAGFELVAGRTRF